MSSGIPRTKNPASGSFFIPSGQALVAPISSTFLFMLTTDTLHDTTTDQRLAQVAQYWQRCYDSRVNCKLSRSLSASDTLISDEDDEDDDEVIDIDVDSDDNAGSEYEYRYIHYQRRTSRGVSVVSGLPLLCGNCGISFFSLQSVDDEEECYCSGECKWSVIMYREMDRRMSSLRANRSRMNRPSTTYDRASDADGSCSYSATNDSLPCP